MTSSTLLTDLVPAAGKPTPTPADASGIGTQLTLADDLLTLLRTTTTEPRSDEQLEALTLAVAADLPVLLWGEPGIGKTAALTQLATSLNLPLTTVIASVHEPSDFSGLPIVGDDPAVQGVPMVPPHRPRHPVRPRRSHPDPGAERMACHRPLDEDATDGRRPVHRDGQKGRRIAGTRAGDP